MGYILSNQGTDAVIQLEGKHEEAAYCEALSKLGYSMRVEIESLNELTLYRVEGGAGFGVFVYALHEYDAEQYAEDVEGLRVALVSEVEAETIEEHRALGWTSPVLSAYPSSVCVIEHEPYVVADLPPRKYPC